MDFVDSQEQKMQRAVKWSTFEDVLRLIMTRHMYLPHFAKTRDHDRRGTLVEDEADDVATSGTRAVIGWWRNTVN